MKSKSGKSLETRGKFANFLGVSKSRRGFQADENAMKIPTNLGTQYRNTLHSLAVSVILFIRLTCFCFSYFASCCLAGPLRVVSRANGHFPDARL